MEDRIEQQTTIRASHDKVWHLISRPGWWLPGGATDPARGLGRVTVVCSGDRRPYVIDVIRIEPQGYISFRWASAFGGLTPLPGNSTLVEFYVRPVGNEVGVTVVESGFSLLNLPEALRESERKGNAGVWRYEMAGLRTRAERVPAERPQAGQVLAGQSRAERIPARQAWAERGR
jgi:hypothetical protein